MNVVEAYVTLIFSGAVKLEIVNSDAVSKH